MDSRVWPKSLMMPWKKLLISPIRSRLSQTNSQWKTSQWEPIFALPIFLQLLELQELNILLSKKEVSIKLFSKECKSKEQFLFNNNL